MGQEQVTRVTSDLEQGMIVFATTAVLLERIVVAACLCFNCQRQRMPGDVLGFLFSSSGKRGAEVGVGSYMFAYELAEGKLEIPQRCVIEPELAALLEVLDYSIQTRDLRT